MTSSCVVRKPTALETLQMYDPAKYRLIGVLNSVVLSTLVEPLNQLALQRGLQAGLEHVIAVGGDVFSVTVNGLLTDTVADDGPS
ncbi:hypothetical protein DPMN_052361 [Dreissena polymorpha]|uniref:Uncharacterized protein n=1 Tax=Dreissena polymorpha TaxID=45954 RepID=A0A9D4CKV7_DREPO|nr:hypothetical protein DPMN_052356 [Dreissena polymorpha]KAH3726490.1 hypothetical protein DPMN_052357 [Dreissena polymorpha]KAH3726492.1 hypothetical protein DPMN_052359 [Dreissena polymorpha]KAH3726493.1 hypothetical protein DPMN_052360 [Dreissena polymorpha]KAH3726494.1 hypothetical protein DPMN_052361 [Dreissena polymorpha]